MADVYKIYGPPGTGKTTHLMDIVNDKLSGGYKSHEVMFASFTRAAAHEARDRAILRFGGEPRDYPYFNTEHSICFRLLGLTKDMVFNRKHLKQFANQYNYELSSNSSDKIDTRFQEGLLQTEADYYEFFVQFANETMLPFHDAFKEFSRSNDIPFRFGSDSLELYIERRTKYKLDNNLFDFSDMIKAVIEQRLFPQGVKVVILDEMQDSSRLLWELAYLWKDYVDEFYIAGDPLQTLYFWSGASPELFYDFKAEEFTLSKSYRLPTPVKDYAYQIISNTHYPKPEFTPSGRYGEVIGGRVSEINWNNVGHSFVLARTRYIIQSLCDHFISLGIPFVSERGFKTPLSSSKSRALSTIVRIGGGERVSTKDLQYLIKHTSKPFLEHGSKTRITKLEPGMWDAKSAMNLGLTHEFFNAVLKEDYASILCKDVEYDEIVYLDRILKKHGVNSLNSEPNITVTTMHGSKGRERDEVYILPDMTRRVHDGVLRNGEPEALVYYVATTRAKSKLILLNPIGPLYYKLPAIDINEEIL